MENKKQYTNVTFTLLTGEKINCKVSEWEEEIRGGARNQNQHVGYFNHFHLINTKIKKPGAKVGTTVAEDYDEMTYIIPQSAVAYIKLW